MLASPVDSSLGTSASRTAEYHACLLMSSSVYLLVGSVSRILDIRFRTSPDIQRGAL
jgi:hypothetical protein